MTSTSPYGNDHAQEHRQEHAQTRSRGVPRRTPPRRRRPPAAPLDGVPAPEGGAAIGRAARAAVDLLRT
ncbi:hypothetical protein ACIO3O_02735 [Streptomyces sp. NPDC087440]|uniref:hypothetical protein n=1 Tax=Streptomyces sp. NPDC087440 TaxID=3365790 RepID=UPI00382D65C5